MQKAERIVSEKLKTVVGQDPKIQSGVVKCHAKELGGRQLREISDLEFRDDVKELKIKRSGTGLTILVMVDNEYWD